VHANGSIRGPRAPRHETNTGAPRQLALRLGHEGRAALLATGDKTDPFRVYMKAIKHGQIAFTRHAERMGNTLGNERFDQ
jgi:hypothetical protein